MPFPGGPQGPPAFYCGAGNPKGTHQGCPYIAMPAKFGKM
jgi:hypothetical protein